MTGALSRNGNGERELVRRAQGGDPAAFNEIYALHYTPIYRLCFRMTGNDADAEDFTQETFLSVWKGIKSFQGKSALGSWIHRIAINVVLMKLRKKSVKGQVSIDELLEHGGSVLQGALAAPDRHLDLSVDRLAVNRVLFQLSSFERLVICLCDVEGYHQQEVALMLDITIPALKSRLSRGRRHLRSLLGVLPKPAAAVLA